LFRQNLAAALVAGLARGGVQGVQAGQQSVHASGLTVRIDGDEVGVHLDSWSGALALLARAGYHLALPGLSEMHRLSRAPITLTLSRAGKPPERAACSCASRRSWPRTGSSSWR